MKPWLYCEELTVYLTFILVYDRVIVSKGVNLHWQPVI